MNDQIRQARVTWSAAVKSYLNQPLNQNNPGVRKIINAGEGLDELLMPYPPDGREPTHTELAADLALVTAAGWTVRKVCVTEDPDYYHGRPWVANKSYSMRRDTTLAELLEKLLQIEEL